MSDSSQSDHRPFARDGTRHVVVLGGGFAGLYTVRHLEKLLGEDAGVSITLVSRENYFLMSPLLFEAGSGVLEPRHAVNPIRPLLKKARFVEAQVLGLDLDGRNVRARAVAPGADEVYDIPYDHVVIALGGVVNTAIVPGAEQAMKFKTLADAIALRNHVIQTFERADVETDAERRRAMLTFIIVGGGLVGVELVGELTVFLDNVRRAYHRVARDPIRVELIEGGPHLVPEFERELADYAEQTLRQRGVSVRTGTRVGRLQMPAEGRTGRVTLASGEEIESDTIVAAMGVSPSPVASGLPLERDKKGRVSVEATLRSRSHKNVWALGDCASIPDPEGKPYPPLAQHALREARTAATNLLAVLRQGDGATLEPFVYKSKGTLAALGHFKGVGRVYIFHIYGFVAWWVWRTYYVMQMPQWSRRVRIVIDWTVALLFKNDVVQLDFTSRKSAQAAPPPEGDGAPGQGFAHEERVV